MKKTSLAHKVASVIAIMVMSGLIAWSMTKPTIPDSQFVLLDGSKLSSQDMRGKVFLVNFWATSCTTCVAEMPELVATYEKYHARGLDILAVAMAYDPPSYVMHFAQTRQLPFKVAMDHKNTLAPSWAVLLTPTLFLVAQDGSIIKQYVGQPEWKELHAQIEQLLGS